MEPAKNIVRGKALNRRHKNYPSTMGLAMAPLNIFKIGCKITPWYIFTELGETECTQTVFTRGAHSWPVTSCLSSPGMMMFKDHRGVEKSPCEIGIHGLPLCLLKNTNPDSILVTALQKH
jgi:hypothetical protein